ncbi:8216_t:CDS:2 [Gigaspora rosea]|nr:8216_t:CDS:2 [Gigaspora rosea]
MTSVFAAVSFIETVQGNTSLSEIAMYKHEYDEFVYYKFKAFVSVDNQHMINKIEIMLLIGRFVLENSKLNVTILQAINLDLKTIENEPTVYDLPVTLLFGYYLAPCKSSEISKDKPLHFTLKRRGYNSITSNYLMIEIDCAFDAGTARHAGIPTAIENKAILSVCGELYKGNNMMHIIASDIE